MVTNQTITCPQCGNQFTLDDVLTHQIEERVKADARRDVSAELQKKFDLTIKDLQDSSKEEKERNKQFQDQIIELSKELRKARQDREDEALKMAKKLAEEEDKIRAEVKARAQEEHELKDQEKDKKLTDALKQIDELKTRMEQGSQQTQGEVLELEIETLLKKEFPSDIIAEVKKGQRGADVSQEVVDKLGRNCGVILWESKNAQWSHTWITKLKEDQRVAKAHLAVLVATNPPEHITSFGYEEGVWIVSRKMVIPLAIALRFDLVRMHNERMSNVGKQEKSEILYQYITSVEFRHRIEAIIEAFGGIQEEMEREKRWFQTKWARQEKQLRQVIDHTQGMYGDLQGVIGKSLPSIQALELEPSNESPLLRETDQAVD